MGDDLSAGRGRPAPPDEQDLSTIPLVEETARLTKQRIETGRVRVSTHTETTEELLSETLRSEAVEVTRVPVDRVLKRDEDAPGIRTEGGLTIIPILEEVAFVERRLVLKEELHVRRTASVEDVEIPITLRRQRASIERVETSLPDLKHSKDETS